VCRPCPVVAPTGAPEVVGPGPRRKRRWMRPLHSVGTKLAQINRARRPHSLAIAGESRSHGGQGPAPRSTFRFVLELLRKRPNSAQRSCRTLEISATRVPWTFVAAHPRPGCAHAAERHRLRRRFSVRTFVFDQVVGPSSQAPHDSASGQDHQPALRGRLFEQPLFRRCSAVTWVSSRSQPRPAWPPPLRRLKKKKKKKKTNGMCSSAIRHGGDHSFGTVALGGQQRRWR